MDIQLDNRDQNVRNFESHLVRAGGLVRHRVGIPFRLVDGCYVMAQCNSLHRLVYPSNSSPTNSLVRHLLRYDICRVGCLQM